jgi:hypothetical protein
MFMWFLKEHEKPGLYNVMRQALMRFSGRPQPLRILDETPSQYDSSDDRESRDAEDYLAAEQDVLNSNDPLGFDQDILGIPVVNNSSGEQSAMH